MSLQHLEIVMTQPVADNEEIARAFMIARFANHQHALMERVLKGADPEAFIRATQAVINRGQTFHAPTYFQSRNGLYVWDSFATRVLPAFQVKVVRRGLAGVTQVDLPRNMNDSERYRELQGGEGEVRKHVFTPDQIADQIDLQPNGEDGELLTNGCANLFDVLVGEVLVVVSVRWNSVVRLWHVFAWSPGEFGEWGAGKRVFRNMN